MVNNILGYLQLWWKRRNTRRAAEQGNAEAQNNLGVAYYWGHGVAEEESEV